MEVNLPLREIFLVCGAIVRDFNIAKPIYKFFQPENSLFSVT
jgi:hypothetical protein